MSDAMTVIVQIGNSDDKLLQARWSDFNSTVNEIVIKFSAATYFHGHSANDAKWQNACWVFDIDEKRLWYLKQKLSEAAHFYDQDSIALTIGTTEFVLAQAKGDQA